MNRDYRLGVSLSKRVEFRSSHTSFIDNAGNPLSRENNSTAVRLLELWYRMCIDVLSSVTSRDRVYDVCCSWLSKQPSTIRISEWIGSLEELAEHVIHRRPLNLQGATPVKAWLKVFFRSKAVRLTVPRRDLYSLVRFPKRLTLVNAEDLARTTEDAFFENASRVAKLNEAMQFTMDERFWIQKWLKDYKSPTLSDCRHSGGSTAAPDVRNDIAAKYAAMTEDPYTWQFCVMTHIPPVRMYSGDFLSTLVLQARKAGYRYKPDPGDYVPSRLQFVPKSYKTYRSIAMEGETRMFYQNGVKAQLVKLIHRKLRQHIDLENQERSRTLALKASQSKEFATIDKSMASDSVSMGLFSLWFEGCKFAEEALMLRARSFIYEGCEYITPMAFTMGSPLCFPVQCLVFLAMAYSTIAEFGDDPRDVTVLVYGDDVIIPSKYAEAYMHRAERNGFLINWSKSYYKEEEPFREACGMEAFEGEDITPLYVPRKFSGNIQKSKSSYIHLANAAYGRGYFGMRRKLLHWLTHDLVSCLDRRHRSRKRNRFGSGKYTMKSFINYTDDINALINESSTVVFDPEADRLNKPNIRYRRAPYKYGTKIIQKYIEVQEVMTVPSKSRALESWPESAREKARLAFSLHYKPEDVEDRYAARSATAKLLKNEPFIWIPKTHRGFEKVVTHMAVTIRPYDT